MTMSRALHWSAILHISVSFVALIATGKLQIILILLGGLSIAAALMQFAGSGEGWIIFRLSRVAWNGVMIVAFLASGADLLWGTQDLLQASMYVLVLLMIHKLFTLRHHTDFLHLYVVGFLEFLSAAVLTVELWYAIVFVAYLLTAIWALLLWHLNREADEMMAPRDSERVPLSARFFWTTNLIALGSLGLTLAIFFLMPRSGFGFFQKIGGSPVRTTGFSEKVDLGGIGAVKQDPSLVMRVQFPDLEGPPLDILYFRGVAFDRYDGRSWTNTFARRRVVLRNGDGIFTAPDERDYATTATGIRQQILIEALDTSVLFGMSFINQIHGEFLAVQTDESNGWSLPVAVTARFQYVAVSVVPTIAHHDRTASKVEYPPGISNHYLQLPKAGRKIADLAASITSEARTPYERILAVQRHLMSGYRYSLDVGTDDGVNPIEDFLFTRKTGYCEHYATAMVLMLRTLGIPARLVTGFLPGEWNEFGNYYRVRQQDAHAWVEVFFPRSGWITFDPTPTVGTGAPDRMWQKLGSLVDSARLKWDRFVIQYSFRDQIAVARAFRERSERVRTTGLSLIEAIQRGVVGTGAWVRQEGRSLGWLAVAAMIAAAGALVVVARRALKIYRASRPNASHEQAMVTIYCRMLHILASQGLRKGGGCTPQEFAHQVTAQWKHADAFVAPLTDLYYRVRYGHEPLLDRDRQRAEGLLNQLLAISPLFGRHPIRWSLKRIVERWNPF